MATAADKPTALAASADPLTGEVMPFGEAPLQAASAYGVEFRVSDLIRTPAEWQEFPQVPFEEICNVDLIIHDAMIFPSQEYEGREFTIMKLENPTTREVFTSLTGGSVVIRKLRELMEFRIRGEVRNVLPVAGQFRAHESKIRGHSDYYDLV